MRPGSPLRVGESATALLPIGAESVAIGTNRGHCRRITATSSCSAPLLSRTLSMSASTPRAAEV